MLGEAGIHILYSMALGVPPLKAGRLPSIPTVCAESTGTLPAPYGGLMPHGLNVPAVAAPSLLPCTGKCPVLLTAGSPPLLPLGGVDRYRATS